MARNTLYNKIWDAHVVGTLPTGQQQLFIGLHMIHEVTSPQAFAMLREQGLSVPFPGHSYATVDHIVPTDCQDRPFGDPMAEQMMQELEKNTRDFNIPFFNFASGKQGIVHVIAPENGLTQPGMTIACGDSHTATHGAFGTLAFGIGTSQVRDVLATGCLAMEPLKVRKIDVSGSLGRGVTPKDVILYIINLLGVKGGIGYVYEYAGEVFDRMAMEGRMTVCNMSIEGGARAGYVNPDETTFSYLEGREYSPRGEAWDKAVHWWKSLASDDDAEYDDVVSIDGEDIEPMVTWGITPGQSVPVGGRLPAEDPATELAYRHMGLKPGMPAAEIPVNVAFIGSCTNGRISDLRAAARQIRGRKVAAGVRAFVVPGSQKVKQQAEAEGLDALFRDAGFEWRNAGCSMCLAMNPDKLKEGEISASSSNRNFIGRQGHPKGRTVLLSPEMVAAAAIAGRVTDVREDQEGQE